MGSVCLNAAIREESSFDEAGRVAGYCVFEMEASAGTKATCSWVAGEMAEYCGYSVYDRSSRGLKSSCVVFVDGF